MPTPTRRSFTRFGVGAPNGGSSTGNAGVFGYHTITPVSGAATIDIGILGGGVSCFCFRIVLNATSITIPAPIWTGGSIVAGVKIWVYFVIDPAFLNVLPVFATGSTGTFHADANNQQLDGTFNTITCFQFTYHGTRWILDVTPVGTGMSLT